MPRLGKHHQPGLPRDERDRHEPGAVGVPAGVGGDPMRASSTACQASAVSASPQRAMTTGGPSGWPLVAANSPLHCPTSTIKASAPSCHMATVGRSASGRQGLGSGHTDTSYVYLDVVRPDSTEAAWHVSPSSTELYQDGAGPGTRPPC